MLARAGMLRTTRRRDLIEDAKQRWRDQAFPSVPDETEFISLPER